MSETIIEPQKKLSVKIPKVKKASIVEVTPETIIAPKYFESKEVNGLINPPIDPTFIFKPGLRKVFDHLVERSATGLDPENVLLKGVQGCGKTETCMQFAAISNLPMLKLNCALIREPRDWFGHKTANDGTVSWVKSEFSKLVERGNGVILLDEITRASPPVMNSLLPLLDGTRQTFLEEVKEVIKRGPNLYFFATANIGTQFTGTYGNLDSALDDRFAIRVECDYLEPKHESELLTKRTGIDLLSAQRLVEVATKIRASANGKLGSTLSITVSTRNLIDTAVLYKAIGKEAFDYTIVPLYSSKGGTNSQQAQVLQIIQSQFGV